MAYKEVEPIIKKLKDEMKAESKAWSDYDKSMIDIGLKVAIDVINEQPIADVEEAVRCKDCKHANYDGTICRYSVGRAVEPNHFCSYGERKED